jgi:hypothetical protein
MCGKYNKTKCKIIPQKDILIKKNQKKRKHQYNNERPGVKINQYC